MAVKATFQADFSSFIDAVNKADVSLRSFDSDVSKVEKSLNKMTDAFSGRKILEEGAQLNRLFATTQDIALLTEKELRQVGNTAAEAVEKMGKLGLDVPPGLKRLADAAKDANTAHSSLGSTVRGLATDFAALFTARAAFNFVADVINDASALQDLSNQTHINVEEIQRLAGAMSEFGVDTAELAKGLFGLSRRVAGGDESVAKALETMGLSLAELRGLNGEQLFLKIEHGLSQLQGGLRDTTASELFGSKLGMAMAGASDGIDEALDAARRLNTVMSQESVEALDRYGESIERAQRSLTAMAANMIGPVAEGFNVVITAAEKGAPKWDLFVAMLKDFAASTLPGVTSATNLATVLDHLNQETEKNAGSTTKAAAAQTTHAGALRTSTDETRAADLAAKQYADAVATVLKQVQDLEKGTKAAIDFSIGAVGERSRAELDFVTSAIAGYKSIEDVQRANADFIRQQTLSTTDYQIAKITEWKDAEIAAFQGTDAQVAAYTTAVTIRAQQRIDAINRETQALKIQEQQLVTLIGESNSLLRPDTQSGIQAGPVGGTATNPGGFSLPPFSLGGFSLSSHAAGGPTREGPAFLHAGEFVVPKGGALVSGGSAQASAPMIIQLVVDGRVLAQVVNDQNTRFLKQSRQLPSA